MALAGALTAALAPFLPWAGSAYGTTFDGFHYDFDAGVSGGGLGPQLMGIALLTGLGALGILSARDIQKKKLLAVLTAIGGAAVLATVATAAGKIGDLGRSNGLVSGYITGASVQVGLLVAGLGGIAIITGTVVVGLNSDK